MNMNCPCYSGKTYDECCENFHKGQKQPNPVELMRSRYSAYALSLPRYIIKTTYPKSPYFEKKTKQWEKSILEFCKTTEFLGLDILSSSIKGDIAYVTFFAQLKQNDYDASFTEKSLFRLFDHQWFYDEGKKDDGLALNLI